ncbi:hypothetical protein VSR34_25020 [Paraburkholderia sp. JHI2823]|uniref:hypothetical protein n=1 Tax=Paraburkholderia sp. JHI2823 TaxID=3112960 RepID=UPI00318032C9
MLPVTIVFAPDAPDIVAVAPLAFGVPVPGFASVVMNTGWRSAVLFREKLQYVRCGAAPAGAARTTLTATVGPLAYAAPDTDYGATIFDAYASAGERRRPAAVPTRLRLLSVLHQSGLALRLVFQAASIPRVDTERLLNGQGEHLVRNG